MTLEAAKSEHL